MARPTKDLDPYRASIELRVRAKESLPDIVAWLSTQGVSVNTKTLARRTKLWGATRRAQPPTPELVELIKHEYHSTKKTDAEIADSLIAQGFQTTSNQVQDVRLANGWKRRERKFAEDDPRKKRRKRERDKDAARPDATESAVDGSQAEQNVEDRNLSLECQLFSDLSAAHSRMGETDLTTLLASLTTILHPETFVYITFPSTQLTIPVPFGAIKASIIEAEGLTVVTTLQIANQYNLSFTYPCRKITLNVHSSLEAVGFMAVITSRLTDAAISVNPISGFYHDHLFVPEQRADETIEILRDLAQEARAGLPV